MPVTLVTRAVKGSSLTHTEMDNNLSNLKAAVDLAKLEVVTVTTNTTLSQLNTILVDASAAPVTLTLPPAALNLNKVYVVKRIDSIIGNVVTLDGNASEVIDGALTATLTAQWQVVRIISNGTAWFKI